MRKIRVGSRDSKLAIIQTQIVIDAIRQYDPTIEIELITMKTTGDKILNVTLDKIGGKGLFVKELDDALRNHEVDLTVHSFKDMPMELPEDLPIVAVSKREDPRDVLIRKSDGGAQDMPVGCSSKRRTVLLHQLGYEKVEPLRGNVQTRMQKLEDGQYSAIVLAAAGIKRLQLEGRIDRYFSVSELLPAACQGVLAVQTRKGELVDFLAEFHSPETEITCRAERAFVAALDGGCSSPIAAYAELVNGIVTLTGMYVDAEGTIYQDSIIGKAQEAEGLGQTLARQLKARGANR